MRLRTELLTPTESKLNVDCHHFHSTFNDVNTDVQAKNKKRFVLYQNYTEDIVS